jgi:hypothetical protein
VLLDYADKVENVLVPHANFKKAREFLSTEKFNPEEMKNVSEAAGVVCEFVINIIEF